MQPTEIIVMKLQIMHYAGSQLMLGALYALTKMFLLLYGESSKIMYV